MKHARGLAVLVVVVSAAYSQAAVAFDNFGPGDTFNQGAGLTISGSTSSAATVYGQVVRQAVKFTSSSTGMLDYIQYAAGLVSGTDRLVVTLLTDNSGALGSQMISWSTSGHPTFAQPYGPMTITNNLNLPSLNLTAGTSYWLLLEPDENTVFGPGTGSDTWAAWNLSPSGSGDIAYSQDGGLTYQYIKGPEGAFRVVLKDAAVPGPAAALPFALGLLAARRRRK